ncbi:MAG: hypothetical protein ACQES2_11345 [Pseudomonadota bacterium]
MEKRGDLLDLLERSKRKKQNLHVKLKGSGQLVVLGGEGLYRQSGCSLEQLLAANPSNTTVKSLSDKAPSVKSAKDKGRELEELLWMIAYELSEGDLLFGAEETDVFKLHRWPNFTRIPHTDDCLRIAALVTRRATSVRLAAKVLNVPIQEVKRFYSAAKAAGYTNHLAEKAEVIQLDERRENNSFISSLLNKLKRA